MKKKALKSDLGNKFYSKNVFLPIDKINVLRQHRETFDLEGIRDLANHIASTFLMEPVVVACLNEKNAQEYINLLNKFYKTDYDLKMLIKLTGGNYAVLISGERRLRAHQVIWLGGCSECQDLYGQEKPGTCWSRHFSGEKIKKMIETRLCYNLSAIKVMDLQLSGNNYIPPPEDEVIKTTSLQYLVKKELNPRITIKEFAKGIGKSSDTVGKYLQVYNLPPEIYEYYDKKSIPYGIAVELAFLKNNGETDLAYWANWAISKRVTVERFKKVIRDYLGTKDQGILEIFTMKAQEIERKRIIRKTVNEEMVGSMHSMIVYWRRVLLLFQEEKLGKEDSPFSEKSPASLYRKQIDLMKTSVLPHLREYLPKKDMGEIEKTLDLVSSELVKGSRDKKTSLPHQCSFDLRTILKGVLHSQTALIFYFFSLLLLNLAKTGCFSLNPSPGKTV